MTASQILSLDTKLVYDFFFKEMKPFAESIDTSETQSETIELNSESLRNRTSNLEALFSFLDQETLNYTSAGTYV